MYVLLTGDYNFHMELPNDINASTFRDLLVTAGMKQHVNGPTHQNGHTLDLIIDWEDDKFLSDLSIISGLPSDHDAVLCSVTFSRPKPIK